MIAPLEGWLVEYKIALMDAFRQWAHTGGRCQGSCCFYSRAALMAYDAFVLGFSNALPGSVRRGCWLSSIIRMVSADHLDIWRGYRVFPGQVQDPVASPMVDASRPESDCLRVTERSGCGGIIPLMICRMPFGECGWSRASWRG